MELDIYIYTYITYIHIYIYVVYIHAYIYIYIWLSPLKVMDPLPADELAVLQAHLLQFVPLAALPAITLRPRSKQAAAAHHEDD